MKVVLSHSTETGLQEIPLDGESLSFGRGSEADYRFDDDDGLSRLHATIFRDGDKIWIVDENSTNGTFVNGRKVDAKGTVLEPGDSIRIGNYTTLKVKFAEESVEDSTSRANRKSAAASDSNSSSGGLMRLIPIAAILLALFVISISAVVIGYKTLIKKPPPIASRDNDDFSTPDVDEPKNSSPRPDNSPKSTTMPVSNTSVDDSPKSGNEPAPPTAASTDFPVLSGKKYGEMSEAERFKYVEAKLYKVATIIGNRSSDKIPEQAIERIKQDVDGYFKRIRPNRFDGCTGGTWLKSDTLTVFERASKNVPFISRAYVQEGLDQQIGIYVAMIESEHCPCLQSGTGPLGMFQFTTATAKRFFANPERIIAGSNPSKPDDRCDPKLSAPASAKYLKYLMSWFGGGPSSVPLAIAGYNSGEGRMRNALEKTLNENPSLSRDFWSLLANYKNLPKQFQDENMRYPPKFFAAAIIGENPADFGLPLQPLSTYTK